MKNSYKKIFVLLFVLLGILVLLSLSLGSVYIPVSEIFTSFFESESSAYRILHFVRMPRVIAAVLCGTALSCSGLIIQSVLQNPLGSPNVLGMNSGSVLFVIIFGAFFADSVWILPFAAFSGAFVTLILVCLLGRKAGSSKYSIILAGVAMNAFLAAVADGVTVFIPDTIYSRNTFRIGSLNGVQMNVMTVAGIVIVVSVMITYMIRDKLDVLSLGDESAASLGMNVNATRFCALVLSSLLCGAGVSFSGLVGFIGLIVPHCARLICGGNEMKLLVPMSVLLGSCLVLFCDLISRILFAPYELPVGILLSIIGGPFFFYLLVKTKRGRNND